MKNRWYVARLLAFVGGLGCTAALPGRAADGRLIFTGSIVERSCPMRGAALACPPGRRVAAVVREFDPGRILRGSHGALLAYALERSASTRWRFLQVTYR